MSKARDIADSASVINALDGVSSSGSELNLVDGSTAGGIVNSKAVIYGASGEVNATTLQIGGTSITSSAQELNVLQGIPSGLTAAELGYVDGVTSSIQTQLDNISVTNGTLTKTFTAGETATVTLTSNVLVPSVAVTKEVAQSGVTNNDWNVNSSSQNYTRYNSAAATSLSFPSYNIASKSAGTPFSVNSQETAPQSVRFNTDGTKMFITGTYGGKVYEFTLSTAFDVSSASVVDYFSVYSQQTAPRDFQFNTDGTKMFVVGTNTYSVHEYALSTGFDISSASYTRAYGVSGQTSKPVGIAFNTDGTKMFIAGGNGDNHLYEYAVSSGFDMSSVSYTRNYDMGSNNNDAGSIAFDSTGKRIFITYGSGQSITEFALASAFDLSSVSYTGAYSTSSEEAEPRGLAFNNDGTKLFVTGENGDEVNQYTLSRNTAVLGSGSFASADVGKTIEINSGVLRLKTTTGTFETITTPSNFNQASSGSWQLYGTAFNTTDGDLELSSFSDVYNFAAQTQLSNSTTYSGSTGYSGATHPVAIHWGEGSKTRMVTTVDMDSDQLLTWQATAANDLSSFAKQDSLSISSQTGSPTGFCWADNGNKAYICDSGAIYQYTITSSYQASGSYANKSKTGLNSLSGVLVSDDGTQIYACRSNGSGLYHYTMSTAFDLSTASAASTGNTFSLPSQTGLDDWADMVYQDNGNKLYIIDTTKEMFEYNLATAYRIETASFVQKFSVASPGDIKGFAIRANGARFYAVGSAARLYEYSIGAGVVFPTGYHAAHTTTSTDSTYWTDINSMTASESAGSGNIYYCVSTDDRTTWKIAKGTDGERSIVRNNSGTWQYNSNGTYGSTTWANASVNAELYAIQEAMTGASAGSPYDLANSTAVTMSSAPGVGGTQAFVLKSDGTRGYYVTGSIVYQADLPSAFTGSGGSWGSTTNFNVSSQETGTRDVRFKSDGSKMYIVGYVTDAVYQYSLSTAWDVTTASYDSVSFSVSGQASAPSSLSFSENGSYMYIHDNNSGMVYQYNLSSAWDLSSASYSNNSLDLSSPSGLSAIDVVDSGTRLFASFTNIIKQYSLSSAYDISSASATSDSISTSYNSSSIQILDNGGFMALVASSGSEGAIQDINTTTSYPNQMNKTQLDAIPDANHFTLANDLDLAIIFNVSSGSTVPSSDGVSINYDANTLNQGAVLGTDYNFDAPAQNKVRITSVNAANLKVRIV